MKSLFAQLFAVATLAASCSATLPVTAQPAASATPVAAPTAAQREALVAQLVEKHGDRLMQSQYMRKKCEAVEWPGWEGYPTIKCRYPVVDRPTSTTKYAEVVMLNASPARVAHWVVTACYDAGTKQPEADADRLYRHILGQSGGQFPVAGVVYEDMEGDGFKKVYCFRDGVTVRVKGVQHRTTATLTPAEIEASLTGEIETVFTYARISSTTPQQYKDAGGTRDVGTNRDRTLEWPRAIAEQYQRAWNSDRNELISAWAKANLGK